MNGARVRWMGYGWRRKSDSSSRASRRSNSDCSHHTQSTDPTEYSCTCRPCVVRSETCRGRLEYGDSDCHPWESTDDYVSTIASDDEDEDGESSGLTDSEFEMEVLDEECMSEAVPASPREFGTLFPSSHRICIRHDDSTVDGNMNLRLDTQLETRSGQKRQITLFHLRMHDLRSRDFSLRRYCRDSGREVCHSTRKYHQSGSQKRPGIPHSLTAIASLLRHADFPSITDSSGLKRIDSGYAPAFGDETMLDPPSVVRKSSRRPTNTIKLEFSNYAHVEVKRKGAGSGKRYAFDYWGFRFSWKRRIRQDGNFAEVSYHLMRDDKQGPVAHIVPVPLTTRQAEEERSKGGWIPPCSMWISDDEINTMQDVADVVVATGLMSLVDDSIRRRWHSKRTRRLLLPIAPSTTFRMNWEYIGPKRLIDEVFNRPTSATKDSDSIQRFSTRRVATT